MKDFKPLYEDEHLLAANKQRGILTVGNKPGQKNLLDMLKRDYEKKSIRLRPLNRLDRGTSGIVLFAKTRECFEKAVEEKLFSQTQKIYLALIRGIPKRKTGQITFPLPSRQDKRKLLQAKTRYRVLESYVLGSGAASLVEAKISSGRYHQIRRHFAKIRHPLLMDREYMDRKDFKHFSKTVRFRNYFLHAGFIEMKHFITGENLLIEAPVPKEFKNAFRGM